MVAESRLAKEQPHPSPSLGCKGGGTLPQLRLQAPSSRLSFSPASQWEAKFQSKKATPEDGLLLVRIGGRYKDRTCDPFHVKEVLYR